MSVAMGGASRVEGTTRGTTHGAPGVFTHSEGPARLQGSEPAASAVEEWGQGECETPRRLVGHLKNSALLVLHWTRSHWRMLGKEAA